MNTQQIRHYINVGITFGVVVIFLVLIGFTVTAAELTGSILKQQPDAMPFGLNPEMMNLLVFLGLIGLWAGFSSVRLSKQGEWGKALMGGAISGGILGLMVGVLALLVGTLYANGVKMSTYLAQLLPSSIELFLLGKTPLQCTVFYVLFFAIVGILGSGLAYGLKHSSLREGINKTLGDRFKALLHAPAVLKVRSHPVSRYMFYGLLLLFVFLLPLKIGQYWNYTMGTVGIYVLLGLGLNIVVGLAGLLDLGYVAFFAIGAYTVALLTAPQPHNLQWNFWITIPIGIALAATAGILLGIPVLRMRGDYLAIVTLGFGEIIRILSKSDLLTSFSGGPKGVPNIAGPTLFGKPFNSDADFVYLIILAVLLVIFVTTRLQNSHVGRAWIAMREDETVAQAMGINTLKYKLLAFAIGAAFAGLGGVLFASRNQFTGPEDHNLMVSINVLSLVIVGGMGSIPGVIAGAFALKGLPEILRQLENYRILVFGALLVIMMIVRPEGIIPSARRRLEVHKQEEIPVPPSERDGG